MASTIDMMAMFKNFTGAMPFDTKAFETVFRCRNRTSERLAEMAVLVARMNADMSTK